MRLIRISPHHYRLLSNWFITTVVMVIVIVSDIIFCGICSLLSRRG